MQICWVYPHRLPPISSTTISSTPTFCVLSISFTVIIFTKEVKTSAHFFTTVTSYFYIIQRKFLSFCIKNCVFARIMQEVEIGVDDLGVDEMG